jgi:hypothetical protein
MYTLSLVIWSDQRDSDGVQGAMFYLQSFACDASFCSSAFYSVYFFSSLLASGMYKHQADIRVGLDHVPVQYEKELPKVHVRHQSTF